MKNNISTILISLIFLLCSCEKKININDYLDNKSSLLLTVYKKDSLSNTTKRATTQIEISSNKYEKLINWGNKNTHDWKWSPASYIADMYVGQKNFHLLTIEKTLVVISFIDKDGNSKQYTKRIEENELEFLRN
jgi:hypothetical protein